MHAKQIHDACLERASNVTSRQSRVAGCGRYRGPGLRHPRAGFTLHEVLLVMAIAVILATFAIQGFQRARASYSLRSAERSFTSLHARARTHAVERGRRVDLRVDPAGDSAWVELDGAQVERVRFDEEYGVDVTTGSGNSLLLCMTPRGFADSSCNSFTASEEVTFENDGKSRVVTILPLGQLNF